MRRSLLVASVFDAVTAHIERFVSPRGFHADIARCGGECLVKAQHSVPAAMVLDWDLPWSGGAGVLACLREIEATAKVPVVLVSGRFLSEFDLSEPLKTCLQIPGDAGSLYDTVDTVLAETDLATGAIVTKMRK